MPSKWKYRLFYEWDSAQFDGVGILRLLTISSSNITAKEVKDILNDIEDKWANFARKPGQSDSLKDFLFQGLGIIMWMAVRLLTRGYRAR